VRFKNIT